MATFKKIATATPDAASDTSLTSAFYVPGEFSQYAMRVPALFAITGTCNIQVLGAQTSTGETFYPVMYSHSPATSTSNYTAAIWKTHASAACSGAWVISEAFAFVPGWAKLQFVTTSTMNTSFAIYGRKED